MGEGQGVRAVCGYFAPSRKPANSSAIERRARIDVADCPRAEVPGAAETSLQLAGFLRAALGGVGRLGQQHGRFRAGIGRLTRGLDGRRSASTIVLSPGLAWVWAHSFARPASRAAARPGPSSDGLPPTASDMPMKKEPSSGLVEPPSTDITFQPTCSSSGPTPKRLAVRDRLDDRVGHALHGRAMVAIAGGRVEPRESSWFSLTRGPAAEDVGQID